MLVVLSELDCLEYLQKRNIFPDQFYTDVNQFKNRVAVMSDVDVICILTGAERFNKRVVISIMKSLHQRLDSKYAKINSLTVLSDVVLPTLGEYYLYSNIPENAVKMNGWNKKGSTVNPLKQYEGKPVKCERIVEWRDTGDVEELKAQYIEEHTDNPDDKYVSLITIPKIR